MLQGVRFQPPQVELSPEIRWVLLRALGPLDVSFPHKFDVQHAATVAHHLGVAARIAACMGRDALVNELDELVAPRARLFEEFDVEPGAREFLAEGVEKEILEAVPGDEPVHANETTGEE